MRARACMCVRPASHSEDKQLHVAYAYQVPKNTHPPTTPGRSSVSLGSTVQYATRVSNASPHVLPQGVVYEAGNNVCMYVCMYAIQSSFQYNTTSPRAAAGRGVRSCGRRQGRPRPAWLGRGGLAPTCSSTARPPPDQHAAPGCIVVEPAWNMMQWANCGPGQRAAPGCIVAEHGAVGSRLRHCMEREYVMQWANCGPDERADMSHDPPCGRGCGNC